MARKESDYAKFIRKHPMPNFKEKYSTDEEADKFFGLDIPDKEWTKTHNKAMRDLYDELIGPNGTNLHIIYPGGPGQLIQDIESGKYDD